MTKLIDLTGKTFGRLTVVERSFSPRRSRTIWICRCTCGQESDVISKHLVSGHTRSCGCLCKERTREANTIHGNAGIRMTPEYRSWRGLKERCQQVGNPAYNAYGGRGVTVCERWDNFESFLADMGPCPSGMSIDRIDNNGNYSPSNCRWADRKTQCRNRRSNRLLTIGDTTASIAEWSEKIGIKPGTLSYRICHGWTPEEAIRTPLQKNLSFNDRSNADPEIANL